MHPQRLHLGTFTRSVVLEVARLDGSLADADLDVRETSVTSSPSQFESLESRDFDLVFTSPDNVLAYRFIANNPLGRHLRVTMLAALDRGLGLSLAGTDPLVGGSGARRELGRRRRDVGLRIRRLRTARPSRDHA